MNDKVLQAISDALPETQVKMVKDALIERDQLKSEKISLQNECNDLLENQDGYRKEILELRSEVNKLRLSNTELTNKNSVLVEADIAAKVALAEGKLEAVNGTVDKFLRNTIYRESFQHQVVDESPNVTPVYNNGMSSTQVNGVNKIHKSVMDTKEKTTE